MADTQARGLGTVGHLNLLKPPGIADRLGSLDAIIVPTARPTMQLARAADLAAKYHCPLLALCSQDASAKQSVTLETGQSPHIIAVDTVEVDDSILPSFRTSIKLNSSPFSYDRDTSIKRNLALLLALGTGWKRVAFLDDDISVPNANDLGSAAALLDEHDAVGISINEYPDNSVVCHANRETRGEQGKFIGSGALVIGPSAMSSFFPCIYNEDWFFLMDTHGLRSSTYVGLAVQDKYQPFGDEKRVRMEEFGDTLAEGLFWLLENKHSVYDANKKYWDWFLCRRRRFIKEIAARLPFGINPGVDADLVARSLAVASEVSAEIESGFCDEYVREWLTDRVTWRHKAHEIQRDRAMRPVVDVFELIARWGLGDRVFSSR
jgi:hypothetical protein